MIIHIFMWNAFISSFYSFSLPPHSFHGLYISTSNCFYTSFVMVHNLVRVMLMEVVNFPIWFPRVRINCRVRSNVILYDRKKGLTGSIWEADYKSFTHLPTNSTKNPLLLQDGSSCIFGISHERLINLNC